jgi:hypothetical protein
VAVWATLIVAARGYAMSVRVVCRSEIMRSAAVTQRVDLVGVPGWKALDKTTVLAGRVLAYLYQVVIVVAHNICHGLRC